MADHPLRPATDRRLGGLLPHQLANPTQAYPQVAEALDPAPMRVQDNYAVLATVSRGYSPPGGKLPTRYSPVRHFTQVPKDPFSFDLHVLSPPPAFVLSQDQTLHCK